jgi:chemotaxis protein histidine kinase CheA
VGTWAEDPELLATFRAEVEERLASLSAGLLQLEANGSSRQLIAGLFRDAHTVKGSARMMGLTAVLQTAHAAEDLLGALRDGRFQVRRDYVDLLLATVDGISRSISRAMTRSPFRGCRNPCRIRLQPYRRPHPPPSGLVESAPSSCPRRRRYPRL